MIPAGPGLPEERETRLNGGRRVRGSSSRDRGCVANVSSVAFPLIPLLRRGSVSETRLLTLLTLRV